METKHLIGTVVGPTNETHWGQVLILPHAYGIVEVAFEDGGARAAGVHILSRINEALATSPVSLASLEEIASTLSIEGQESVILCVTVGHVLYIVLRGEGNVYLKRGEQFSELLSGQGSISGEVKEGDTILLASKQFSRTLNFQEVAREFDHRTPEEVAERLTLLLHKKPVSGVGSTALIIQFGQLSDVAELPTVPVKTSRFMVIQRLRAHPKKRMVYITAFLIGFFILSVVLGIWKQSTNRLDASTETRIADARHALDEGVALLTLNPVKGRERLTAARDLLTPIAQSVSPRSKEGRDILDLMRQIEDNLTQSLQITTSTPDLFFDATLLKKSGTISTMGLSGTTMGLIDKASQSIYSLDIVSKKSAVVGGNPAFYIAVMGDALYILGEDGIRKIKLGDTKSPILVVSKDDQWGNISGMVTYGGNIYLLDNEKSRIWKYVATETGFSETREYLNPDTLPDLTSSTNMSIDGSVWVGTSTGRVWKFTGGQEDTFISKGVDPSFGNQIQVYTDDTTSSLYVLDNEHNRVVVLEKSGNYVAQYAWSDAFQPSQFIVSEKQKNIYLLNAGKLYTIALK